MSDANGALIRLEGVTRTYRMGQVDVHALRGIDLVIAENDYVAITGPSGSGKSTLMNILGCLDRPTEGRFVLKGRDVSRLSDGQLSSLRNEFVGFVFQTFNLLARATALHNVEMPLVYSGARASVRRRRARETLERVGLSDRMHHRPNELSGGERQRVAVARALVNDPALILADEPTGNLDTATGQEIMAILDELHGQGHTILLVTHEPEISAHANCTIRIRDGLVEAD